METCKLNCKPDRDDGHSVKPLCGICACPSLSGNDIVYSYYYKEEKNVEINRKLEINPRQCHLFVSMGKQPSVFIMSKANNNNNNARREK